MPQHNDPPTDKSLAEIYDEQRTAGKTPEQAKAYTESIRAQREKGKYGKVGGALRKAVQGATFGFGDEIVGGIVGALDPDRTREEATAQIRKKLDVYEDENPKTAFAADLAGSFLVPGAGMARAARGAAKAGKGISRALTTAGKEGVVGKGGAVMAEGAVEGALTGAGYSDEDPFSAALVGGITGAVASPVLGGIVKAGRGVARGAGRLVGADHRAEDLVLEGIAADKKKTGGSVKGVRTRLNDDTEWSPEDPVALPDIGGDFLGGLLKSARLKGTEQKDEIPALLHERSAGSQFRLEEQLQDAFGLNRQDIRDQLRAEAGVPADVPLPLRDLLTRHRSNLAAPYYDKFKSTGAIDDDSINELLEHPDIRAAYDKGRNEVQLGDRRQYGQPPELTEHLSQHLPEGWMGNLFAALQEVHPTYRDIDTSDAKEVMGYLQRVGWLNKWGLPDLDTIPDEAKSVLVRAPLARRHLEKERAEGLPTTTGLHYAQQALDTMVGQAFRERDVPRAQALKELRGELLSRMDEAVKTPAGYSAYGKGREIWAGDSEAIRALESGDKLFSKSGEQIQKEMHGLSEGGRQMYQLGALENIISIIKHTPPGYDVYNKIIGKHKPELEALFGPAVEDFEKFLRSIEKESIFQNTKNKALGGSSTPEDLTNLQKISGLSGVDIGLDLAGGNLLSIMGKAARGVGEGLRERRAGKFADELGGMLTSGMTRREDLTGLLDQLEGRELTREQHDFYEEALRKLLEAEMGQAVGEDF